MEYLFTFIEGIASFISPCLLPMLPIYVSYFVGKNDDEKNNKALINSIGFVTGFTILFMLLGIFASTIGTLISSNIKYIKILFGIIIIVLGLNYADFIKIKLLNKQSNMKANTKNLNFIKSMLFGMIFSISWTPCVGAFLSSALLLIAKEQDILKGIVLMLLYSIGIGIPFIISAVLLDKLKNVFTFIKKNYGIIKKISGVILILMGIYIVFF
ncbi:MAG: cytochrome c biogenesis protein CcdA [Clostridia bacterium]|nr:cytochrome c biogenesis protein CcdA [Clostridia bacterium]